MDADALKWFASLGVGGVLAWGMFLYTQKREQERSKVESEWREVLAEQRDAWKQQAEQMLIVVKENSVTIAMNTAATRTNTEMLQLMKTDIVAIIDAFARGGYADRRSQPNQVDIERRRT